MRSLASNPTISEPERPASHLFYVTRLRRPLVDRAEGIYLWDQRGRRMIDGSSGAMVVNIGHSNKNVLDAMKRQMDRVTFAYRLHFENEPAEELARRLAEKMPGDLDRIFFVSGGSEAVESAIKLEHIPTGITVSMRDEKSQHKNRAKARRILLARVFEHFQEQQRAKLSAERRSMVGSGDRGDRIRTYNYPQNRITDHRIGVDVFDVPGTLAGGNLEAFHKALSERDLKLRLESL